MSLLIIGGTGTLGRQIVLQALMKGYPVRCMVRNFRRANFLKEWGVELVYGDLTKPETLPPCFKGITAIIDASTSRPDEFASLKNVDWDGKIALIEAAKVADIKRFIFFSAQRSDEFENIPLMKLKYGIEEKLRQSNVPYTIFRLTGFYQGLIEQYAIPILENLPIWVTNENTSIAYMDTQDIAKISMRVLQIPRTTNETFPLSGLKSWASSDIITLCQQLTGETARVQRVPLIILKLISNFFGFFEWGQNISNRLAFVEILSTEEKLTRWHWYFNGTTWMLRWRPNKYYKKIFKVDSEEMIELDDYFFEYFLRLLKRLRDINFEDVQKQRNLII